ncbi:MAG: CRISPR-associated protein Cas4 [Nitrososphaerota archaeon]|jgi:CRISPR-associated exonuclease Cas4|nr:CRISPR-associated protein Cas4 [Nitrososphaerota archaeon]
MVTKESKNNKQWLKDKQRPFTCDVAENFISVTDIKQYIYCPRIVYFDRVLHAKQIFGSQQNDSKKLHEQYITKEHNRKDAIHYSHELVNAEKYMYTTLCSNKYELQGNIDCIIKTTKNEYIPVDYKNMKSNKGKTHIQHKYQLVGYALLIEDNYNTIVKQAFIEYIPEKIVIQFEITPTMKTFVKRIIGHIKQIIQEEELPPIRTAEHKCRGGCGHKQICQQ